MRTVANCSLTGVDGRLGLLFAWWQNFRRLVVGWDREIHIYQAFFHVAGPHYIEAVLKWLLTNNRSSNEIQQKK